MLSRQQLKAVPLCSQLAHQFPWVAGYRVLHQTVQPSFTEHHHHDQSNPSGLGRATVRPRICSFDDLTLEEEALTTHTMTVWSLYDCHDRERIYGVLTDALGKPVDSDISPEETATTVSVGSRGCSWRFTVTT